MKINDILELPFEHVLYSINDKDITQLYKNSEDFFSKVVYYHHDSQEDMLEQVISFLEQVSGKKFNPEKLPATTSFITWCLKDVPNEELIDCLREATFRLILLSTYGSK